MTYSDYIAYSMIKTYKNTYKNLQELEPFSMSPEEKTPLSWPLWSTPWHHPN